MPAVFGSVAAAASLPTTNLEAHLDASLESGVSFFGATGDGQAVNSWLDQSGNGNSFGNSVAAERPIWKENIRNGNGVLRFNGIGNQVQNFPVFISGSASAEMFIALIGTDVSTKDSGLENFALASVFFKGEERFSDEDDLLVSAWGRSGDIGGLIEDIVQDPLGVIRTWHLIHFRSENNLWELRINDVVQHTTGTNTPAWLNSSFELGHSKQLGWGGDMGEAAIYTPVLGDAERAQAISYFQNKWI